MDNRNNTERRPSPEALLRGAQQAEHGRLKIFFGAAPGVGKTYEMLTAARAKKAEGVDVVIGVVETHGRKETEALLQGLEIIPRRIVPYKGHRLAEMDIDAILTRRQNLVLVDELAHANAPESRHPKRYMDVEELLAAGIDVYTTLNIQHVESLNDVVAGITKIRVRETVPDSIIDLACDIELIDITPEDLIARLNEGKVYVPEQAERATRNYFSPGNLTALRELALRRTAQRVDAQMVDYMRAHRIEGLWSASERVLVLVDSAPWANAIVRHAKRMADRLRARWTAIHVETPASARESEAERDRIAQSLRFAQRLGAATISIPGEDVALTVAEYAEVNLFAHIIAAKSEHRRWRDFFREPFTEKLIRAAGDGSVHFVAQAKDPQAKNSADFNSMAAKPRRTEVKAYLASLAYVAAAILVAALLRQALGGSNLAQVFRIAVLGSVVTYGLRASLFGCLVSVLSYNFFFLPPLYTFTISDPENVVVLFIFTVVALIASNLAARVRAQAVAARERTRITEELYLFSRKLAGVATLDDLLWTTVHQIALMLKVRVVVLLPEEGGLVVKAGFPPEDMLDEADLAAARRCFEKNQATGRGADTLPGAKRRLMPLRTGRGLVTHWQEFDATAQASLMRTILEEAERLNRFIGNLLDMTRLESGPLKPQSGPADLSDIIGATLRRADKILQSHSVEIDLESGLPLVDLDMVLMEQVLFNLFDNAAKYAPQGSRITVTARHENESIVIRVFDEGEGIPEADLERIFDKFYRVRRSDRQRAGTGLGLAICRGFVEAMGGSITAANRSDRSGAVFTIRFPRPVTPRLAAEALP